MHRFDRTTGYLLGILGGLGLFIWLLPVLRHGTFSFGYDAGLYRRYLLEPLVSLPNTAVPGLDHTVFIPRLVLDVVHLVISNPEVALVGTYIAFSCIAAGAVYVFARTYLTRTAAFFAGTLYLLSAIQLSAHHAFLFKQMVALPLFLLCLICLERGRYGWATILGVAVVLSHQTSSVLLLVIAGVGCAFRVLYTRSISLAYIFAGTVISGAYLLLHPHVARKIASPPVGVFLSQHDYLLWSIPLFILAGIGVWSNWRSLARKPVFLGALGVCLAFVVLHLPFYSRVYVFLDLFLIIPAALGVEALLSRVPGVYTKIATAAVIFLVSSVPLLIQLSSHTPDLDQETQIAVSGLQALPKDASIITSPNLMPWVQGWSRARVYAPGLLKEPHAPQEWTRYWSQAPDGFESEFLATFPAPVYIFARPEERQYVPTCATLVSTHLYTAQNCL